MRLVLHFNNGEEEENWEDHGRKEVESMGIYYITCSCLH